MERVSYVAAKGLETGRLVALARPQRHFHLFQKFDMQEQEWQQGFLTNSLRWLTREEAYELAKRNGQLKGCRGIKKSTCKHLVSSKLGLLFSEDVW